MVFYALFPFAIYLLRQRRWAFIPLLLASLVVAWWYAFVRLDGTHTLGSQWSVYVRPENHVFLFLLGVFVSRWIGRASFTPRTSYTALLIAALLFVILPLGSDEISIVTLWPRFAYSAVCVGVCAIGALGSWPLPKQVDRAFAWL